MRRMQALACTGLATALLLAGCASSGGGGGQEQKPANGAPAPSGKPAMKEVQFQYSITGAKADVIKGLIDEYNKSQTQFAVTGTFVPPGERLQKVTAMIAAGAPPDIYSAGPPDLAALISNQSLTSLDDIGTGAKTKLDKGQFLPILQKLIAKDNKLVAVPVETGVMGLYYNEDLFKKANVSKPPATWDELVDTAKKLTDASKGQWGILLPTAAEQFTGQVWSSFLNQAGGKLFTEDGKKAAFNTPEAVAAVQLWTDLVQKHKAAPLQLLNNASATQLFSTGNAGMFIGFPESIETSKQFPFKTMTARLPGNKKNGSALGGWYLAVPAKAANPQGAYDFLTWLSKPENNVKWNVGMGSLPTQQAVIDSSAYKDYLAKNPLVQPFLDSLKTDALVQPATGQFSATVITLAKYVSEAMYQKSTPKEAIDKAYAEVDKLFEK